MGTRAFSHDSIFIPEGPEDRSSEEAMSQENITDKVKSLQRQIAHNIKFGQKPMSVSVRNTDDAGGSSEDEELPRNPVKVIAQMEAKPSDSGTQPIDLPKHSPLSKAGIGSGEEKQATPVKSLRPKRTLSAAGTIESINLDAVPFSGSRLDNTAAKHKLSIKPKNQRASKKHQRLPPDQQDLLLPELEETKGKKHAEVKSKQEEYKHNQSKEQKRYNEEHELRGSKEERKRHEEHEKLPESKKQKLKEEQSLMEEEQALHEEVECELDEKKQYEIEGQMAREAKEQHQRQMEEIRLLEAKEQKLREIEEQRQREAEELRLHEIEEQRQREAEEKRMREIEENRKREQEEQRQRDAAELRLREIEEQRQREAEEKRMREIEENRKREQEEQRQRDAAELRLREIEEERQREAEEKRQHEAEEQKLREMEELRLQELERKKKQEEQIAEEQKKKEGKEKQEELKQEDIEDIRKHNKEEEGKNNEAKRQKQEDFKKTLNPQEQERLGEELRWQEMEERQTMPRPFTFKVSSGEKQIIFQKVNLSPVTPINQLASPPGTESKSSPKANKGSHSLPSSLYVPHTAILVTGAQLCGTAVNLNQIKDTACKSLLGLGEDKKDRDIPPVEHVNKYSPEGKLRSRTRSTHEPTDNQSSAAILAEWATIRSRILKSAENGKQSEREVRRHGRLSDDYTQKGVTGLHNNLRKTMSANAKFSITPAWQKFTDGSKVSENINTNPVYEIEKESTKTGAVSLALDSAESPLLAAKTKDSGSQDKVVKSVRIMDSTEGCVFAKDLPSFLVPSPPHISNKGRLLSEPQSPLENQDVVNPLKKVEGTDKKGQNINEKPSPFGIKLRRTNYSLRFHSEQQADHKKKKRYSAGDSFEGIPTPLIPFGHEREIPVFSNSPPSTPSVRETTDNSATDVPQNAAEPKLTPTKISIPVLCSESEKLPLKSPLYQKPFLAPKPVLVTRPSSPLAKMDTFSFGGTVAQRITKDLAEEQKKEEIKADASQKSRHDEEEMKEKRSFFPSINIPWREKTDRKTELIRREKPSLHSRHSLDSCKTTEKGDSPQPLWITLALQKQKGFREQQSSREERKQAKEARLVEKQLKDSVRECDSSVVISPTDKKGGSYNQGLQKPPVQDEEKKPDTILTRFERREQLKKSNTLPNSVTVEISDSASLAPSVTKRFSSSDAAQVSTEPAWLALAKRKAKAWSDCPQIIK
ncbi:capping protein inhibiting regulator of actin dynamics-like isoform X1 [Acipenser ruthenus]|uniref:capping protein inhibiting regulator of actin dynamics-like isoform X1 n=1 Tax=Acipenser ruthenus TaxID=7906 RepID=UPI0027415AD4|nr:capping protein inhibiting regulator of actin dynamics-like isoform X1 [Acipenser ruthenus]XP_058882785.1 capping protein inhibiting regulator of actin dynamics-like isoform X1 [Acipenser ruthenus]